MISPLCYFGFLIFEAAVLANCLRWRLRTRNKEHLVAVWKLRTGLLISSVWQTLLYLPYERHPKELSWSEAVASQVRCTQRARLFIAQGAGGPASPFLSIIGRVIFTLLSRLLSLRLLISGWLRCLAGGRASKYSPIFPEGRLRLTCYGYTRAFLWYGLSYYRRHEILIKGDS